MWIETTTFFVSAVQKPGDAERGTLTVRARDLRSLREFLKLADQPEELAKEEIVTDYPFRAVVPREAVAQAAHLAAMGIDYVNFKNAAKKARGEVYAKFLGKIWTAGLDLTPVEVQRRADRKFGYPSFVSSGAIKGKKGKGRGRGHEDRYRPVHSLTEDEWDELMRSEPGF